MYLGVGSARPLTRVVGAWNLVHPNGCTERYQKTSVVPVTSNDSRAVVGDMYRSLLVARTDDWP